MTNESQRLAIDNNVAKAIKQAKRDGITAMGLDNLRQISSRGLGPYNVCHNFWTYNFNMIAIDVAKRLRFPILD